MGTAHDHRKKNKKEVKNLLQPGKRGLQRRGGKTQRKKYGDSCFCNKRDRVIRAERSEMVQDEFDGRGDNPGGRRTKNWQASASFEEEGDDTMGQTGENLGTRCKRQGRRRVETRPAKKGPIFLGVSRRKGNRGGEKEQKAPEKVGGEDFSESLEVGVKDGKTTNVILRPEKKEQKGREQGVSVGG